ncbi:MAG: hypothetical protein OEY89_08990, partial [Gammaproteobacteria bacterium]|nr:hypothetical protein [Gammaproteobacteria bacterium]
KLSHAKTPNPIVVQELSSPNNLNSWAVGTKRIELVSYFCATGLAQLKVSEGLSGDHLGKVDVGFIYGTICSTYLLSK